MRYPLFPRYDKFNGPTDPEVRRNKTRGISRGTRAYGFFSWFLNLLFRDDN